MALRPLDFEPAEVPHVTLRAEASSYYAERAASFTARSGPSRIRLALRAFVAAVEGEKLTLDSLPADFIEQKCLSRLPTDPLSRRMIVREIGKFVDVLRGKGVPVAPLTVPDIDVSAARAAAKAKAKERRREERQAARTAAAQQAPAAAPAPAPAHVEAELEFEDDPEESEKTMSNANHHNGSGVPQVVTAAPARPVEEASPRRKSNATSVPLFPSGHVLYVWRINGPGREPDFLDEFPVEMIHQHGGTLETFLARAIRPLYGPFPGEPSTRFRVEQRDSRRKTINAWEMPVAAPKLPAPAPATPAFAGYPAPAPIITPTPDTIFASIDAIEERVKRRLESITPQHPQPSQPQQPETQAPALTKEVEAIQRDLAELRGAFTALLSRDAHPPPPPPPRPEPSSKVQEVNVLGDLARVAFDRLTQQQALPPPPPMPVEDPTEKAMKMVGVIMGMMQQFIPKPRERDEEIEALHSSIEELKDEIKASKQRSPLEDLINTATVIQKLQDTPLFRPREKTSFIESLKPIVESVATHAPAVIEAVGKAQMQQQQQMIAHQQAQMMAARRGLPATPVAPSAPPPPLPEAPPSQSPIPEPAPVAAAEPAPVAAAPEPSKPARRQMPEIEKAVRKGALPSEVRLAIERLLVEAKSDDEVAEALKALFEEFWKIREKDEAEAAAAKGETPKPSKVGELLDGLDNLYGQYRNAENDDDADKVFDALVSSISEVFWHVGFGDEAVPAKVEQIVNVFIDLNEQFEEQQDQTAAPGQSSAATVAAAAAP